MQHMRKGWGALGIWLKWTAPISRVTVQWRQHYLYICSYIYYIRNCVNIIAQIVIIVIIVIQDWSIRLWFVWVVFKHQTRQLFLIDCQLFSHVDHWQPCLLLEVPDGWVVKSMVSQGHECTVVIWRSWVRTPVGSSFVYIGLLSKLYLNYKYYFKARLLYSDIQGNTLHYNQIFVTSRVAS